MAFSVASFQFLIGAIGSLLLWRPDFCQVCFNSLLVRLEGNFRNSKENACDVSIPYWCDWKQQLPEHLLLANLCFNSLLVRLEAVTKCASYIQRKRFYPQKTNHFLVYLQYYVFPRFSTTPHYQYVMSISLFFKPKCQRTFSVFSLSDDLPIK